MILIFKCIFNNYFRRGAFWCIKVKDLRGLKLIATWLVAQIQLLAFLHQTAPLLCSFFLTLKLFIPRAKTVSPLHDIALSNAVKSPRAYVSLPADRSSSRTLRIFKVLSTSPPFCTDKKNKDRKYTMNVKAYLIWNDCLPSIRMLYSLWPYNPH